MPAPRTRRPAPRTRRRAARKPPAAKASAAPEVPIRPTPVVRATPRTLALPEPPHTHLVCRACARILEVPMEFDQQQALEELLLRAPAGWTVDTITVSMTGACARCRQGPSV